VIDRDLISRLETATAATTEAVERLKRISSGRDWVDELVDSDGDGLKTDAAAFVMGCSPDTARRRAEIASAAGKHLGCLMAGAVWLYSLQRVLAWIEQHEGLPARLAAETRAHNNREMRSLSVLSLKTQIATAG
jgi:hypothetical protein